MAQVLLVRVTAIDWVEGLPESEAGGVSAVKYEVKPGDTEEVLASHIGMIASQLVPLARAEMKKHTRKRDEKTAQQIPLPEC